VVLDTTAPEFRLGCPGTAFCLAGTKGSIAIAQVGRNISLLSVLPDIAKPNSTATKSDETEHLECNFRFFSGTLVVKNCRFY
jgi:hypothetical protein